MCDLQSLVCIWERELHYCSLHPECSHLLMYNRRDEPSLTAFELQVATLTVVVGPALIKVGTFHVVEIKLHCAWQL